MGNNMSGEISTNKKAPNDPSVLVVVGPSGVGKGTLIERLREGNDKFGFSCSHTTREPREGEKVM